LKVDDNQIKETYPFKNNTAFYFSEALTEVRPDRVFSEVLGSIGIGVMSP